MLGFWSGFQSMKQNCFHTLAGLGKPPETYTTNLSESLNLLKQKVNFKCSEWP